MAFAAAFPFYLFGISWVYFWAYHRGKSEGAIYSAEGFEPSNLVPATIGWGAALFVPILNWYSIVHLPTMWYQNGLVIGAKRGRPPVAHWLASTAVPVLAVITSIAILLLLLLTP